MALNWWLNLTIGGKLTVKVDNLGWIECKIGQCKECVDSPRSRRSLQSKATRVLTAFVPLQTNALLTWRVYNTLQFLIHSNIHKDIYIAHLSTYCFCSLANQCYINLVLQNLMYLTVQCTYTSANSSIYSVHTISYNIVHIMCI